ncbi:hypothetical protein PF005_g3652 [Phytophthora fragariae]|uniref:Kinesin-like protein n=2 Tax=Phytophthora fragariae TaxID=53985 RepID=A0A6A4EF29_9STRA|nr:hypothetical protein PF003_g30968 [Phytophthora fragariae]KAE8946161.1 hypothetical protein PF009_g4209 [Phytophthora fragariae]KAE9025274.1 hypothetical protein PF011_g3110 [Phytophthora fragariae]KAE9132095.1 hypothetical protein PF010_g3299 [Phytophthora fragariae]KAE9152496.1 hypothetical protein PF006_g3302 [Phytophthora fragariae]
MEKEEKIRVVVRARPYVAAPERNGSASSREKLVNDQECVAASPENPGELFVYSDATRTRAATFRCDTFLPSISTQEDVFDQVRVKELVGAALDGYPVTIFAYGQTGAGKSYTIFGKEDGVTERRMTLHEQDGLLPRTAQELMNAVSARKGEVEYTLRVTCVEIYNEQVRDVFDPRKETLAVRSSKTHGFFLENATVVECVTAREIVRVVKAAATHRAKSSHLLNERSNRSHCLVTIYIDAAPLRPESPESLGGKRYGKITIVDLAGSERVSDSGAVGTQLRETCHINRSLHCLSQVIQAMNAPKCSRTGKSKFVPYRDSKLTMLLLDSLGGNCKTLMIACVNSSPQFAVESTRTLEFAMGVAKIKNRPTALLTPHEKLIKDLKEQIRLLKLENMMLRARTPGYFLEHPNHEVEPSTMLSNRSDQLDQHIGQQQHHAEIDFLHPPEDIRLMLRQNDPRLRRKIVQQDLQTLKQKPQLRRRSKSPKKKRILKRMPTSLPSKHKLPPVVKRTPPQRSLQYIVQHPEHSYSNQTTNHLVLPRTDSPPPPYNDLFGIETVPCAQNQPPINRTNPHLPPKRPAQAYIPLREADIPVKELSPEEQLQELLKQMLPQSQPPATLTSGLPEHRSKAPQIRSKPINPPAYASATTNHLPDNIHSKRNNNSSEWDDQRAQDLFMQLCRL